MNKYGLNNRVKISNAVDTELYKQLKEYLDETEVPVLKILYKSIYLFLKSTKNSILL